ncbi:zinc-dependent peptidase [Roseovarius faecimaris]|uniref:Zinc-dependent peptidase n=1 Tax=Roseovarius faecimaris TaxID=2494550 RepID=A0A6I6IN50_9RHOB|nr:M90 family metallopeptidase [Roseovarius faecimaris]QGX96917.1 zinc-dependent peptidase [Roseovarius faecimaris]
MLYLVLGSAALLVGWVVYGAWRKRRKRAVLLASPLTEAERDVVAAHVPLTLRLPAELRPALEGKIRLFLDQVTFRGCGGLQVSDEMRLSIAAQACLLVANSGRWYDHLTTILIYPGAFKSLQQRRQGYVVQEAEIIRSGESWTRGPVILSWAHADQGAANPDDGHNVVFHEFAHQIDDLSGHTDGAPLMSKGQSGDAYEQAIVSAFERHVDAVERGRRPVLDPYGAEGYEEFFAVAVEMFFEQPRQLREGEPEVYEQLALIFELDPAAW